MPIKSRKLFEAALDSVSHGVVICDENLIVIAINNRALEILDIQPEQFSIGDPFEKLVRCSTGNSARGTIEERYKNWVAMARACKPYRADEAVTGDKIVEFIGEPIVGGGYVTTYTDVTERKLAENAVRESEQRFRDFAEIGSDWFWEMGPDLKFTYHSPRYYEITGFRPEDKIGTTRTRHVSSNNLEADSQKWATHYADMEARRPFKHFEYEFTGRDDKKIHVRISGTPVFATDGEFLGYRGIGSDITHMIQSAKALRDSEEQFHAFIDNLPSFINLKDTDGRYLLINRKHSEVFGLPQDQIKGKVISELFPEKHATSAELQEHQVLALKTSVTHERQVTINNKTLDFLVTKFPIFDDNGDIIRIGTIGTDFTEFKETQAAMMTAKADAEAAKDEAEAANRSKSDFLAAMSHDLRTPLNAIIGFADAIGLQYFGPINKKYQEYAKDIRWSGEHLLSLIGDILDVTILESGSLVIHKEDISMNDVVHECEKIISGQAKSLGIELEIYVPDQPLTFYADRRATIKIILNLLANALKFTPSGGKISLSASKTDDHCILEVSDSGIGIPADQIAVVTNPFYRGKASPYTTQDGVGLGLSIVKSLVQLHDGTLDIHSLINKGTTVTVSYPAGTP